MSTKLTRRGVAALVIAPLFVIAMGEASFASGSSVTTTGSKTLMSFTFNSATSVSVSSLSITDTACDGEIAYGRAVWKDAYGNVGYGTTRKNTGGCGTVATWTGLSITSSGSYGDVLCGVGTQAWAGSNSPVTSSYQVNPYC